MTIKFVTTLHPNLSDFELASIERYNRYLRMRQTVGFPSLNDEFEKQFNSALALDNFTFQATAALLVSVNEIAHTDLIDNGIVSYDIGQFINLPMYG